MQLPDAFFRSPEEETIAAHEQFLDAAKHAGMPVEMHVPHPTRIREYLVAHVDQAWIAYLSGWLSCSAWHRIALAETLRNAQIARQGGVN